MLAPEFQVAWPITAGGDKYFIFFMRTWRKINRAFFGRVQSSSPDTGPYTVQKKVMMQSNEGSGGLLFFYMLQ